VGVVILELPSNFVKGNISFINFATPNGLDGDSVNYFKSASEKVGMPNQGLANIYVRGFQASIRNYILAGSSLGVG
jgi:hypothetical protein